MIGRSMVARIAIATLLLPAAINIATGALPEDWETASLAAIPVAVMLALALIAMERRSIRASGRSNDRSDSALNDRSSLGGFGRSDNHGPTGLWVAQRNLARDHSTQNIINGQIVHLHPPMTIGNEHPSPMWKKSR